MKTKSLTLLIFILFLMTSCEEIANTAGNIFAIIVYLSLCVLGVLAVVCIIAFLISLLS